jgi:hypothetical protein
VRKRRIFVEAFFADPHPLGANSLCNLKES